MSWQSVPELVGWSLGCTSPSPEAVRLYLSSRMPSAAEFSLRDGQASQSGMTCSPSTLPPGQALSTQSPPASHVSPGLSPAKERESTTSVGSGLKSQESFASFDPDSSSWKTCQPSSHEVDSPTFLGRWPTAGLMLLGACMPQKTWVPRISASGSLSSGWPTPLWNTPTACEDEGTGYRTRGTPKLKGQAKEWTHPTLDGGRPLSEVVERFGHPDQTQTGPESRKNGGRLNSRFVEWLMGFPENWSRTEQPVSVLWEMQSRHLLAQLVG